MKIRPVFFVFIILLMVCNPSVYAFQSADKPIIYSYFITNPVNSIHISWIAKTDQHYEFNFREEGQDEWTFRNPTRTASIPGSDRTLHEVHLTGLKPGSDYEFHLDAETIHRFRTLPLSLEKPINFVTGGDLYHNSGFMIPTTREAAKVSPYFVVMGGDWAYADGDPGKVDRWFRLFEIWQQHMVTPSGYMVPFVPVIGNHEVQGGFNQTAEKAPLYFTFFDKPEKRAYYTLDVSNYLSFLLLDSNHTNPISGEQTDWLTVQLFQRNGIPHVFPAYHVPAWPAFRPFDYHHSRQVRMHWVPLFERFGVQLAFENHDHAFKRTVPILDENYDYEGVVYIGDGAWGVSTRKADDANTRWWLEKVSDEHHFWNITLTQTNRTVDAYNASGDLIDRFTQDVPESIADFNTSGIFNPQRLDLAQNFPNPFNPSTLITFNIPVEKDGQIVRLEVFNLNGQLVATLLNEQRSSGVHHVVFNAGSHRIASGTYIYRLRAGDQQVSKRMTLIK